MTFSAVILAGGKSTRMGQDKAFLEFEGCSLLARQIELARSAGAAEVFVSGQLGVDYSVFGCPVLRDQFPFVGPLAGIERALSAAAHPLLLVLAVDMPAMQPRCLENLISACTDNTGAVPCHENDFEPLAAFYPRQAHSLAWILLGNQQFAARRFAQSCLKFGLVSRIKISAANRGCFFNFNSLADSKPEIAFKN